MDITETIDTTRSMTRKERKVMTKRQTKKINIFKSAVLIGLAVLIIAGFFGAGIIKSIIDDAPPLDLTKIHEQSETSFLYDQDGMPITDYFGVENRIWATLDEIPDRLEDAFIAIEDKRFEEHKGMDIIRLGGAFINNLKGGRTQGASTITQQLVKTLYLTPEQSYKRKIQEAYLATKLEKEYSKNEILEAYLNIIYFEEGNYGVKAASKDYFDKEDMDELTLKEMAVLAGLVRNPSSYNPRKNYHGPEDRRDVTENRVDLVLSAMLENEYISQGEYDAAKNEELHVVEDASRFKLYEMAPFVEYAIYEVRDSILGIKGWKDDKEGRQKAEEYIYSNGLKIYTTLDRKVQKAVEETLYNWEDYPSMPEEDDNEQVQPQAAAVVIDNKGHLKAIVGSRTPPTKKRQLNRATSPLMIGSTIKPISVYGPALEEGKSPASIYHNIPAKIDGWDSNQEYPNNYGGGGFTGPTSMRYGLKKSLNIVAAQALTYDVGFEKSKTYLEGLGIDPSHIQANGSGLALGTSSITPVELAGAYSAIANGGVFHEPISVLKVIDRDGNIIIDKTENPLQRKIFSEATSWMLIDMMKGAVNKGGTGEKALIPGMTVAGKTGTNTDYKGVTFAGITPYYSGVVWIGHDEGKSLGDDAQGGRHAAPLWQAFMARIHEEAGLEDRDILDKGPEELGLIQKRVCNTSGNLAGPYCPEDKIIIDWFSPNSIPSKECDQHGYIQVCKDSGKIPGPYCPEESIIKRSVYSLEENSPYMQLSREQLYKWIPNAYFGLNSTCDVHTEPPVEEEDDLLDGLKDFFEGLIPGKDKDKEKPGEGNSDDKPGDGNSEETPPKNGENGSNEVDDD